MEKQLRENALTTKEDMLEFMGMDPPKYSGTCE